MQEEDKNKLPSPQLIDPKEDCIDTPRSSSFFPRPHFTHPRQPRTPSSGQPSSLLDSFFGIHSRIHQRPPSDERETKVQYRTGSSPPLLSCKRNRIKHSIRARALPFSEFTHRDLPSGEFEIQGPSCPASAGGCCLLLVACLARN